MRRRTSLPPTLRTPNCDKTRQRLTSPTSRFGAVNSGAEDRLQLGAPAASAGTPPHCTCLHSLSVSLSGRDEHLPLLPLSLSRGPQQCLDVCIVGQTPSIFDTLRKCCCGPDPSSHPPASPPSFPPCYYSPASPTSPFVRFVAGEASLAAFRTTNRLRATNIPHSPSTPAPHLRPRRR
ncbi:hypothetical protein BKA80DRAFT_71962 [Phyllosticta citrichinensis]